MSDIHLAEGRDTEIPRFQNRHLISMRVVRYSESHFRGSVPELLCELHMIAFRYSPPLGLLSCKLVDVWSGSSIRPMTFRI